MRVVAKLYHIMQYEFSEQVLTVDCVSEVLNFAEVISASFLTHEDKRLRARNYVTLKRSHLPTK